MLFFQPNIPALKAHQDILGLVRAIRKRGDKTPVNQALEALHEVTELLKEQATERLAAALPEARKDPWKGLTDHIISCLGQTRDPRAFDVLLPLFGRDESVILAFGSLGDKRAVPHLIRRLEELVQAHKNAPPVSLWTLQFSKAFARVIEIRDIVIALHRLRDSSALSAIESCRGIDVKALGEDARFNMKQSVDRLFEEVDEAIRDITGTSRTPEEIEAELRKVIHEIACGREHGIELRYRLEKLGQPALPVFDRIVQDLPHHYRDSFPVETALKYASEYLGNPH